MIGAALRTSNVFFDPEAEGRDNIQGDHHGSCILSSASVVTIRRAAVMCAATLFSGVTGYLAATNAIRWSGALNSGDTTGTYAKPVYGNLPIREKANQALAGKLAGDHASLYFSARNYLDRSQMYDKATDPWGRTAVTFPPSLIFLTAHSTARMDFVQSALINNFAQVFLLLLVGAYFVRGGPSSWTVRIAGVALGAFLLFCSPVGVTWFERAQTDLYCASAMLLLLKGIRDEAPRDFALAGLAATFKWSCLPFFAIVAPAYVLLSRQRVPRRALLMSLAFLVPFVMLLFSGGQSVSYLKLVQEVELVSVPEPAGVSLQLYFPRVVAKALPFALPLLFLLLTRRCRSLGYVVSSVGEVTFLAAAGLAAGSFGTTAFEYRFVSLLFLVPLLVDGRSAFFGARSEMLSRSGRIVGVAWLIYGFRIETIQALDTLVGFNRGLVPLTVGLLALTLHLMVLADTERDTSANGAGVIVGDS